MKNIIVPLNAFSKQEVLEKGQQAFVKPIAGAGAYGIEIRRELFLEEETLPLEELGQEIRKCQLFTVYSAPIELWLEDGQLNREDLQQIFSEAVRLGAHWVKISLGYYNEGTSDINQLKTLIEHKESPFQLLVENDQTRHGGHLKRMCAFFESVRENGLPIQMTFDAGNWLFTGEDPLEAIKLLSENVIYLHLKHVEKIQGRLATLPLPTEGNATWRQVMGHLPPEIVKALEFPIESVTMIKEYIDMLQESAKESE